MPAIELLSAIQAASPRAGLPRLVATLVLLVLATVACSAGPPGDRPSEGVELAQAAAAPRQDVPSALDDPRHPDLPEPTVDPGRIVSGGVPPDGIPAIDRPRFEPAGDVDWLADREPVISLTVDEDTRAYPVQVLMWHEIVNDTVGDVPVVMTYCPLCNSALAFERTIDDRVLEFGVSGRLYNSSLVMYDRQTESLWSHFVGEAVAGALTGTELVSLPIAMVSWSEWRQAHPGGWVLSRDTGFDRPYGENPYVGYDRPGSDPFLFEGSPDPKLPPKTRVVGISEGDPVAVVADTRHRWVVEVVVGERPLVVWMQPGTASALDTRQLDEGRDVGQTGVFEAQLEDRELSFVATGDGFVDDQTGSTWNVLGQAIDGPLEGRQLAPVPHVDTFWFAWAAFQPETRVLSAPAP